MLDRDVAVVSVMAVNNETGVIQPVQAMAARAAAVGAFSHCDATQAPLAMRVDMEAWGVDAASLSGHKVYGPKGIGALYLSGVRPWTPQPLTFGGGQEGGLRPGTVPTALCVGFAKALALLDQCGADERVRVASLRDRFLTALARLNPEFELSGGPAPRHPGNAHVRLVGEDAADILARMQPRVAASLASACTSGVIGPSHVLTAMGFSAAEAANCIRFSIGRFTDEEQVDRAVNVLAEVLSTVRAPSVRSAVAGFENA